MFPVFPDDLSEDLESFAKDQAQRNLRHTGLAREGAGGWWLILIARDPEREYSAQELQSIKDGLRSYRDRLGLESHFDNLTQAGAE